MNAAPIRSKLMISTLIILAISIVLILISFRTFAANQTLDLNSDHAVHILMTYDLELPNDLYYWGQDRLGSLLPILGHFLGQVSNFSPIESASYAQYLILILGYCCLIRLFRTALGKIAFAFAWFLPPLYFTELTAIAQPYGPQYALIGLAIVAFHQVTQFNANQSWQTMKPWTAIVGQQSWLAVASLSLWASLWVSDLSVITLAILLGLGLVYLLQHTGQIMVRRRPQNLKVFLQLRYSKLRTFLPSLITISITSIVGLCFISWAKSHATTRESGPTLAGISDSLTMITQLARSLFRTLTFQAPTPFLSLFAGLTLALLISFIILGKKPEIRAKIMTDRWLILFFLNAVFGTILLCCSQRVYNNAISLRYFVFVYVSYWIAAILAVEKLDRKQQKALLILLVTVAIAGSFSLPTNTFSFRQAPAKIQQLSDIRSLGNAGFIGEYWHSYILCTVNPKALNCTPRDPSWQTPCPPSAQIRPRDRKIAGVRCPRCARRVLRSKAIYVVKNDWFEQFPAEIEQFGRCLVKVGAEQQVAGATIAQYRVRNQKN